MEIAEHLKQLRTRSGFTQEDVADRIYVSRQTLSNWETGKTYPDIHSLLLLSNLYGVSIDEMVKGDLKTMNEKVSKDAQTLKHLGWATLIFLILMFLSIVVAVVIRDVGPWFSNSIRIACAIAFLFAGAFFLCAFASAVWAEVLKRQNDVVTFKDILAFEKGIPIDQAKDESAFGRKHPIISTIFKMCSGAIFGIFAIFVLVIVAKYVRDFIFMILA